MPALKDARRRNALLEKVDQLQMESDILKFAKLERSGSLVSYNSMDSSQKSEESRRPGAEAGQGSQEELKGRSASIQKVLASRMKHKILKFDSGSKNLMRLDSPVGQTANGASSSSLDKQKNATPNPKPQSSFFQQILASKLQTDSNTSLNLQINLEDSKLSPQSKAETGENFGSLRYIQLMPLQTEQPKKQTLLYISDAGTDPKEAVRGRSLPDEKEARPVDDEFAEIDIRSPAEQDRLIERTVHARSKTQAAPEPQLPSERTRARPGLAQEASEPPRNPGLAPAALPETQASPQAAPTPILVSKPKTAISRFSADRPKKQVTIREDPANQIAIKAKHLEPVQYIEKEMEDENLSFTYPGWDRRQRLLSGRSGALQTSLEEETGQDRYSAAPLKPRVDQGQPALLSIREIAELGRELPSSLLKLNASKNGQPLANNSSEDPYEDSLVKFMKTATAGDDGSRFRQKPAYEKSAKKSRPKNQKLQKHPKRGEPESEPEAEPAEAGEKPGPRRLQHAGHKVIRPNEDILNRVREQNLALFKDFRETLYQSPAYQDQMISRVTQEKQQRLESIRQVSRLTREEDAIDEILVSAPLPENLEILRARESNN